MNVGRDSLLNMAASEDVNEAEPGREDLGAGSAGIFIRAGLVVSWGWGCVHFVKIYHTVHWRFVYFRFITVW